MLKILYQIDLLQLKDVELGVILENNKHFFKGLNETEKGFVLKILEKVMAEKVHIDDLISKNLIHWKLERLMSVDRNLIRMGIAESHFNDQKAVVIDDVVRIAKKYGGEESYKLINAILDKVIT